MRGRSGWVLALLAGSLLLLVGSAAGGTGTLDPSFGNQGTVTTFLVGPEGNSPANALLLQPDGKIVAVGDSDASPEDVPDPAYQIAVVRYNPDGSRDASFGSDGVVTTTIPGGGAYANAAVLQPDGKIVVAGYQTGAVVAFAVVRYNPDGSLDPTFGTGGIVTTPVGDGDSAAFGVQLQPDGKIVAGGEATTGSNGAASALVRYLPDGSLDTSFGTDGIVVDSQTGENGFAGIALQPDGKILGVGRRPENELHIDWATTPLTRFDSDGTLDSSFGTGGVSDAPTGQASALALQPDGKIVVVGTRSNSFAVSRVDPDGTADPSFGSGGTVTTPMGPGGGAAFAVVLQPDAKIVVAGGSQGGFTVARYNPNGSLDPRFGSGGIATTLSTAGPYWTQAAAGSLALQPDARIVAAGWSSFTGETGTQLALARYLGNGGTLTVQKAGSGTGVVTSSPAGITCGATCTTNLPAAPVTLTATPSTGSRFAGWSGACSGTGACQVQMSTDESVTAGFTLVMNMLTIARAGKGHGSVSSSPAGITCGSTCTRAFTYGTAVTLLARPASGSTFKGWSGACSQTARSCTVTMNQALSATATFRLKPACIVPRLKGKSLKIARHRIARAHCRTGTIGHRYSKVEKGHVVSQKPRARRHLRNGAKVSLVVSKGKRP